MPTEKDKVREMDDKVFALQDKIGKILVEKCILPLHNSVQEDHFAFGAAILTLSMGYLHLHSFDVHALFHDVYEQMLRHPEKFKVVIEERKM